MLKYGMFKEIGLIRIWGSNFSVEVGKTLIFLWNNERPF